MENQPVGPALRKRQLAKELTALRAAAGLDLTTAGEALGVDRTQISHYESQRNPRIPTYAVLVVLLQVYRASDRLDELNSLRKSANERGWWDIPGLAAGLRIYLGLEDDAIDMRRLALEIVPGILQTEEYARVILGLHKTSLEKAERHVALRMQRRARVDDGDLTLSVVLSEGVLLRASYMGRVGLGQLQRFREDVDRPGLTLRVLPFSVGAHRGMVSGFTLLQFPAGSVSPIALHEQAMGNSLSDDPDVVGGLEEVYQDVMGSALNQQDTTEVLEDFIDGAKEIMNVAR